MLSAAVLLPLPDSPTSAVAEPEGTTKSTPRTACTAPWPV